MTECQGTRIVNLTRATRWHAPLHQKPHQHTVVIKLFWMSLELHLSYVCFNTLIRVPVYHQLIQFTKTVCPISLLDNTYANVSVYSLSIARVCFYLIPTILSRYFSRLCQIQMTPRFAARNKLRPISLRILSKMLMWCHCNEYMTHLTSDIWH